MEIVQLSDIHFGAQFREDAFVQVIDEVNALSPDAVIINNSNSFESTMTQIDEAIKRLIQF